MFETTEKTISELSRHVTALENLKPAIEQLVRFGTQAQVQKLATETHCLCHVASSMAFRLRERIK